MNSFNPKISLIRTLEKQYKIEPIRGKDIIALNSEAILYIRYNKNAGPTKNLLGKFWFGITKSEYDKYLNRNLFIVCSCVFQQDEIDYLVFPSEMFEEFKNNIILRSGQWKFNLLKTNDKKYLLQISQKGKYDVTEFLNYFDFTPFNFRKYHSDEKRKFEPKRTKQEEACIPEEPVPLEDELLIAARDSDNPKNFEIAIEKFFKELGFPCKMVGGPGETDILVLEPVRIIIDVKSTRKEAKSAINFTRIKRHMKENYAEFMLIVSVGFDPAVVRDAESEGATLIDIHNLINMLKLHKENILSPFDYIDILNKPGNIDRQRIDIIREKIRKQNNLINKSQIIMENIDFIPKNLDEIKGRIDLYCEQKNISKIDKNEISMLLDFFSCDFLKIVRKEGDKYYSKFLPSLAKKKLINVIKIVSEQI